ncbi:MAG: hypothetical protein WC623_24315 [Pedobacter sp.]|uniref:hypothetical protein n=1 Tax=Pedobacter sp. TaxID=1411316 RepID=UPI003566BB13
MQLKYIGLEPWIVTDDDTTIIIKPDTVVEVSGSKAKYLLEDYPESWEKVE